MMGCAAPVPLVSCFFCSDVLFSANGQKRAGEEKSEERQARSQSSVSGEEGPEWKNSSA